MRTFFLICMLWLMLLGMSHVSAEERFITVASTTSTEQSGLFKVLLPVFEKKFSIAVRVLALGTGQALDLARRGDADVVLVHDREAEEQFLAQGYALERFDVMYNDFVLVGPKSDPLQLQAQKNILNALIRIAKGDSIFISRGDRSGTHLAELRLWKEAHIDPTPGNGRWYRQTGSGMGPSLNVAAALQAYILTDRGTWLAFKNRTDLSIVFQQDQRLLNPYGVMLVNPLKFPHVKKQWGQTFIQWLVSEEGQKSIAAYHIDNQSLFFPNAKLLRSAHDATKE